MHFTYINIIAVLLLLDICGIPAAGQVKRVTVENHDSLTYYPHFDRIDLVTETMPSKSEEDVYVLRYGNRLELLLVPQRRRDRQGAVQPPQPPHHELAGVLWVGVINILTTSPTTWKRTRYTRYTCFLTGISSPESIPCPPVSQASSMMTKGHRGYISEGIRWK